MNPLQFLPQLRNVSYNSTQPGSVERSSSNTPTTPGPVYPIFESPQSQHYRTINNNEITVEPNEYVGDILGPRDENTIRFLFGNVNGLQIGDGGLRFDGICKEITSMEVDCLGLSEINTDTTKFEANKILHDQLHRNFHHYSMAASSSSIPAATLFKPGGTLSMVHNDLVGRVKSKGADPLGRWSYLKLQGKSNKIVTFITAYQVCKKSSKRVNPNEGMTAYVQQERLHRDAGRKILDPRYNFVKDLKEFLTELKAKDELIILCGDFNEALEVDNDIMKILSHSDLDLIDVIGTVHPETTDINTYDRGTRRRWDGDQWRRPSILIGVNFRVRKFGQRINFIIIKAVEVFHNGRFGELIKFISKVLR